jgi:prepilin-type processing-associated H-X9-DG protein
VKDLAIAIEDRPGALAEMGDALGRAGVSIEGGGAWVVNGEGVAHFLFADGHAARRALERAAIRVVREREVIILRLKQTEPGQLGKISRRLAEAGVNIEVLYSDHDHRLILVVDDIVKARAVSEAWTNEGCAGISSEHYTESSAR